MLRGSFSCTFRKEGDIKFTESDYLARNKTYVKEYASDQSRIYVVAKGLVQWPSNIRD